MHSRILAAALTVLFGLLSVGPALAAGGQYGNLSGTITDAQTHAPIAGATVVAKSPSGSYTAKTDARGHYSILSMNVDTYVLTVDAPGYTPQSFTGVIVFGDENDVANETVTKHLKTIANVTSTAQNSAFQPNQTIDTYTVSGQRVQQALGNAYSNNEAALIQSAPGVIQTYDPTMGFGISIRGSLNVELGYQYDGVPFDAPFFNENASQGFINGINGGSGGSLQIVSGAGDATQGNVGGGVINTIVPRGTYPAAGNADLEVGGPYYNHTVNLNYSLASPNERFSDYASFSGNAFVPDNGPLGVSSAALQIPGVINPYYGFSYERHNDFVNNFLFRFGKNNNQSLQFLYRATFLQTYGNYGGGLNNLNYFPDVPAFLSPFAPSFYTSNAGLLAMIPSLPYAPANLASPVTAPELTNSNPLSFVKLSYTNALNPRTFLSLSYYNWGLYEGGSNYTNYLNAGPFGTGYQIIGGSRTGGIASLTHEFGENDTLSIEGKVEGARPYWNAQSPGENVYALAFLSSGNAGGLSPASGDWAVPTGGVCPAPGPDGCWVYDHLPAGAAMPQLPTFGINYHNTLQQQFGLGIRDQYQPTDKLNLDFGVREDIENNKFGPTQYNGPGGTPSDVGPSKLTAAFLTPHIIQPRFALSYRLNRDNSLRFSYARSTLFFFGQTLGTPFNVTGINPVLNTIPATTNLPYCGSGWHGPGPGYTHNPAIPTNGSGYFFTCPNYAAEYAWFLDQNLDAPDLGGYGPPTYTNFDLAWSHLFTKGALRGWSARLTGYTRRGFNVEQNVLLLNGPPNPLTGQSSASVFTTTASGNEKTAGIEAQLTTPDVRPGQAGLSGFITFDYINELLNTPPVAGASSLPILNGALLQTGQLFKASFVPPVSAVIGATYHFKQGMTITPTIFVNDGYPFGVGQSAIGYVNGVLYTTPQTNYGAANLPYAGISGPGNPYNASYYVDPQVPGSILNPNIAGSRGYAEPALAGEKNSPPQAYVNLDIEAPIGKTLTVGADVFNVFDNHNNVPLTNPLYQAAGFGVAGPQTGTTAASVQGLAGASDLYYPGGATLPYLNNYGLGTSWNFYIRTKL